MGTAPAEFTSVIAIVQSGFDPRSSRFERWARSISAAILSPASIEPAMTIARRSLGSSSFQRFLATARSLAASEVRRTETYRTLILPQQPAATVSVSRPAQSAMMRLNLGPRPRCTRFWIVAVAATSLRLPLQAWSSSPPSETCVAAFMAARWPEVTSAFALGPAERGLVLRRPSARRFDAPQSVLSEWSRPARSLRSTGARNCGSTPIAAVSRSVPKWRRWGSGRAPGTVSSW
jgi:hypothetical protein